MNRKRKTIAEKATKQVLSSKTNKEGLDSAIKKFKRGESFQKELIQE